MDVFVTPSTTAAPLAVLALCIAALGGWVALDLARRVPLARRLPIALRWLAGAAVSLATGIWSAQVLLLGVLGAVASLASDVRFSPAWALAAFLWACALAAMAIRVATGPRTPQLGAGLAALAMAAAVVGAGAALWMGSGLMNWNAAAALSMLAAFLACTLIAWIILAWYYGNARGVGLSAVGRQTATAMALGFGVFLAQALMLAFTSVPPALGAGLRVEGVQLSALTVLASVGCTAFLLLMMLSSQLEAQMRESLVQVRRQLHKQSFMDPLTELPGRQMFENLLINAGNAADLEGRRLALLVINLDGFKPINESFGHEKGDEVLREMANRLRTLARPTDTAARLGADEFLLLMTGDVRRDDVTRMATRVLETLSQPYWVGSREAGLSCSIGIAMYPEHGAASALISHAELAVRSAKATGGAAYAFFEAHMASGVRDQMDLLRDLRNALAGGQLTLFYQPKVHAPSGEITGAEALMRWNHPQRGLVSPEVFIPIAERFGLIGTLGGWMIEEACRQIRAWRDEGLRMRVAINLSVHQLRQVDLPERIEEALNRWSVNPRLLTCEITETVAMEDIQATQKIFQRLSAVGVHISIDDFGTGYSSLAYLRKLPAEELKIDRSFVNDLATSPDARAVVDAVVKLAQALGLKLVAEGVETEEQHHILRGLGCDELQGYLFARPMSAAALGLWAMKDVGPGPMGFRDSLFEETKPIPLG
jgi:diguanylate cyclase (GGDEF)-like protein